MLQRAALYTFSIASVVLFAISAVAAYRTPPLQHREISNSLPSNSTILWDNYLELAGYHMVKQEYPTAITTANKAIAILPREPGGYWYRAIAHLESGHKDKAISDLKTILEFQPQHANAQALLQELAPAPPSSIVAPGNWRK